MIDCCCADVPVNAAFESAYGYKLAYTYPDKVVFGCNPVTVTLPVLLIVYETLLPDASFNGIVGSPADDVNINVVPAYLPVVKLE